MIKSLDPGHSADRQEPSVVTGCIRIRKRRFEDYARHGSWGFAHQINGRHCGGYWNQLTGSIPARSGMGLKWFRLDRAYIFHEPRMMVGLVNLSIKRLNANQYRMAA